MLTQYLQAGRDEGRPSGQVSVVIVDDHHAVRAALRLLLDNSPDIVVVGEGTSVSQACAVVESRQPDVVLLDLRLGGEDGLEVARRLRASGSRTKILVFSAADGSGNLRDALVAGADGFLSKSVSARSLVDGVRRAANGETVIGQEFAYVLLSDAKRGIWGNADLTEREREVLRLVADGMPNHQIARTLGISARTVQKHVQNLFSKLGVRDRAHLVAQSFRRGLLT